MRTFILSIILILPLAITSCKKEKALCMKGTVIGKIRSGGGGLALSLDKNYTGAVKWNDEKNVIELLNIPTELKLPGTIIYFSSREATDEEQGIITADGDESIKTILYGMEFNTTECPN